MSGLVRVSLIAVVLAATIPPREALVAQAADPVTALSLTATAHPPLPASPEEVWIAPPVSPRASQSPLTRGVQELAAGRVDAALPLLNQAPADALLRGHQQYYRAVALTRAGRVDDARAAWSALIDQQISGAVGDAVRLRAGEFFEANGDPARALTLYEALSNTNTVAADDLLLRLGRVRRAAGDTDGAAAAYRQLYDTYPLSDLATTASAELTSLNAWDALEKGSSRYAREMKRAERLFTARRYAQARDAYAALLPVATGEDEELISLRVAESDHYLKRYRAALTALQPWLGKARRRAEVRFFTLTATRELGEHAEYVRQAEALVAEFPTETWAEETLNNLATHYILVDEDEAADATFRRLARMFPAGRYAPRAAWKIGWNAYRQGRHAETVEVFEAASAAFPRSDYRPSWIYWSARSRDQLGDTRIANRLYGILVADYLNSYYGRLATRTLTERRVEPMTMAASVAAPAGAREDVKQAVTTPASQAPRADVISALIASELFDDALAEVQWAQKTAGDSPALQATTGLIYSRKGELRRGITAVRRAYPQFIAAGGEELPTEVLEVIFPIAYWDLIQKHAPPLGLDPYLIAALMAQESTFDAAIRSHANAIGLMQVVPSTGRRYAKRLKIPRFTASRLTDPEVNVRIGTAYFADLVERFGGVHHALASYNAGPSPVSRWIAEKPGVARDEFIDDIPYPETQNYVKRILGTAEDYRRLYHTGGGRVVNGPPGSAPVVKQPPKKKTSKPAPRRRR